MDLKYGVKYSSDQDRALEGSCEHGNEPKLPYEPGNFWSS